MLVHCSNAILSVLSHPRKTTTKKRKFDKYRNSPSRVRKAAIVSLEKMYI
jgi:hypothetical protein